MADFSYYAELSDGSPLPSFIYLDANSRSFNTYTDDNSTAGTYEIKIYIDNGIEYYN